MRCQMTQEEWDEYTEDINILQRLLPFRKKLKKKGKCLRCGTNFIAPKGIHITWKGKAKKALCKDCYDRLYGYYRWEQKYK